MLRFLTALLLAAPAAAAPVAYSHATIIDGTGAPPKSGLTVVVDGERITAIVPDAQVPSDATRVDLTGKFLIPGLIDSHVHMATPPNRVQAEAMLRRDLYGGVTAVRDMADDLRAVAELARASRQAEIAAPDIYYAALMAGRPFFADRRVAAASKGWAPGTAPWMQAIDDRTDLRQAVTLAKGTGATAIKIYADLPKSLIDGIAAEAHRQGLLVWAHSAVFPTRPADVIASGADSVSHVCYLGYQLEPVMLAAYEDRTPINPALLAKDADDPVIARLYADMLTRGTVLDATAALFVNADPVKRKLRCTGAQTVRLTSQAFRTGVPITTGTDSVAGPESQWPDVFAELTVLARDVGLPPLQVIRAATLNGSRAAGQDKEMGSIEPGKLANLVVLAKSPLADIRNVESVITVIKRGKAYARADYRPVTADEMKDN